jgi:hypothetical protein
MYHPARLEKDVSQVDDMLSTDACRARMTANSVCNFDKNDGGTASLQLDL